MQPPPPAIDPAAIQKLIELGGNEFAAQMIDLFFDYAPGKIAEINTGAASANHELVRTAAHPLKSSAGNIGATELRRLSIETETAATDGHTEKIPALAAALTTEFARVTDELRRRRRELAP